jgi:ribosomal protein S6--L-glutamate ligase
VSVTITFLLGRAPGPFSVLAEVRHRLARAGLEVPAHLLGDRDRIPAAAFLARVAVLRSLPPAILRRARALEEAGVRCCNPVAPSMAARDKASATLALAGAGLPVPATWVASSWLEVLQAPAAALVAKPVNGSRGAGVVFLGEDRRATAPPFGGPYLVQHAVARQGADRKLYVVGDRAGGVLRPWPAPTLADKLGRPFRPGPELLEIAFAAGSVLDLEVYGVDLVIGPDGPVVVDVNAFPGFKGVPEAAGWIAGHLRSVAAQAGGAPCVS